MGEEQRMPGVSPWVRFLTGSLAVSRVAHHGEEGQHDGEGLEHFPRRRGSGLYLCQPGVDTGDIPSSCFLVLESLWLSPHQPLLAEGDSQGQEAAVLN